MPDLKAVRSRKPYVILMTLLVAVIILCIFFYTSDSFSEFLTPYISKQSEQFTELYFTDFEEMPKVVDVGKSYPVGFAIVNHENRGETYEYRVTAIEGPVTTILETSRFSLESEQRFERQIFFTPSKAGEQSKIVIELLDRKQRISFTMQNSF